MDYLRLYHRIKRKLREELPKIGSVVEKVDNDNRYAKRIFFDVERDSIACKLRLEIYKKGFEPEPPDLSASFPRDYARLSSEVSQYYYSMYKDSKEFRVGVYHLNMKFFSMTGFNPFMDAIVDFYRVASDDGFVEMQKAHDKEVKKLEGMLNQTNNDFENELRRLVRGDENVR